MHRTWRLVLLGPPGAGQDTQARLLSRALGACPLSLADIGWTPPNPAAAPGPAPARALARREQGETIPDDVVFDLVCERSRCLFCRGGFILLDGLPRNLRQARLIEELLATEFLRLDAAISYEPPADADGNDDANPPSEQRNETVSTVADTRLLREHYHKLGLLLSIDASGRPEEIFARTLDRLAGLVLPASPGPSPASLPSPDLAVFSSRR